MAVLASTVFFASGVVVVVVSGAVPLSPGVIAACVAMSVGVLIGAAPGGDVFDDSSGGCDEAGDTSEGLGGVVVVDGDSPAVVATC